MLQQLAPALFLLARPAGVPCVALRVGRRQQRHLAPDLRQQLLLLLLQLLDLAAARLRSRRRPRSAPTAAAARWRGPCRPRRRRPGWPARWPAPWSASRRERALTRITSSGVSWNTRLKPSGSTKRTVSSAACTPSDTSSAHCRVLRPRNRHRRARAQTAAAGGAASSAPAGSSTSMARRSAPASRAFVLGLGSASVGLGGAGAARGAPARVACTSSVSRSMPPMRTRTRAPRGRLSAPSARNTSGSVVGAHQAVLHHAWRRVRARRSAASQRSVQ